MTAMVVRIERVTSPNAAVVRKAAEKPKASALKSTPPPKYKYNKNANRKTSENMKILFITLQ